MEAQADSATFLSVTIGDISPCGLIQETLAKLDNPDWRIFVACSLMNMTVGLTMRPYMWEVFRRWPTPQSLADADESELRDVIRPLGFYNRRAKTLIDMSKQYVARGWKTPMDLTGCGKYATDSWKIFCNGECLDVDALQDKELRRYVHWLNTGVYVPQTESV